MNEVEPLLRQAAEHHRAGRLGLAARAYRDVLALEPGNADALHMMSAMALSGGQVEVAEQLARQAVAAAPGWFAPLVALGNALHARADLAAAEQAFRAALAIEPKSAEALCNLANVLNDLGHHDQAMLAAARSVSHAPDLPEAHNNFGNALMGLDGFDDAASCYRRALALRPDYAEAWYNLGGALFEMGEEAECLAAYGRALELRPDPEWRYRLGCVLSAFGRHDRAEAAFRQVLAEVADHWAAQVNLSNAMIWQGRPGPACEELAAAVERHPDSPELRWNLALALLRLGRMAEAWPHYEWRWRIAAFAPYHRDFGRPAWDGRAPLAGRTVLVHAEQGFGDAIQFARFVPELVRRGAKVVLECRRGLGRLMTTLGDGITILEGGGAFPAFDLTVPLLSLGALLAVRPETLPVPPYLGVPAGAADFSDVASAPGLGVGLVWSGSRTRARNGLRSLDAAQLEVLTALPGMRFYGLQPDAELHPAGPAYQDLGPRLGDFADTAAAIMALDVVVTVDTAVAHLAGALGRPALVMLSNPCDGYFWMLDRGDSPWYPSVRLIRQTVSGDWTSVLAAVGDELRGMAAPAQ